MRYSNFHTHTSLCDGSGLPDDYCRRARALGFTALGFSAHAPVPLASSWNMRADRVGDYRRLVAEAKTAYVGELEVYLGMEADYIASLAAPDDGRIASYGLDYVIGSVHFLKSPAGRYFTIDDTAENVGRVLADDYAGDGRAMVEDYFDALEEMLATSRFDILGHLDLAKKNNAPLGLFDEDEAWYRKRVRRILDAIERAPAIVEVNTGGMARKKIPDAYPSRWILEEMSARGIPAVLNADAHEPSHLDYAFSETAALLKEFGFSTLMTLTGGKWIEIEIN